MDFTVLIQLSVNVDGRDHVSNKILYSMLPQVSLQAPCLHIKENNNDIRCTDIILRMPNIQYQTLLRRMISYFCNWIDYM